MRLRHYVAMCVLIAILGPMLVPLRYDWFANYN